jgi:RNA polymerase sigma-70 factor (ECF subfamily)
MDQAPGDDSALLVQGVARGDRDALVRLYDRFGTLVFTASLRLLRARAEAEDLLQEVFLQVWRQASAYDPERGSPEAWLLTIARSRGIDKLRSMRRSDERIRPTEDVRPTPEVGVASGADPSEARVTVGGVLASLPDAQRRVLELAYFEGLTLSEIATRLGEPLGTVKTRMRTGLERMRGALSSASGVARS